MILVIGTSHVTEISAYRAVLEYLNQAGQQVLFFQQDMCLEGHHINLEVRNSKVIFSIQINEVEYDINDFQIIWYLHPFLPRELLQYRHVEYRDFIARQFWTMREGIRLSYRTTHSWLNDPVVMMQMENKLYQHQIAEKVGFTVPNTMISSNPEKIRGFYSANYEDIVVKNLATFPILDHVIYTNKISKKDIDNIDSVKLAPSIFQERIEKDFELRVVVVGENIVTVKILSQEDEGTKLDWRQRPHEEDYEVQMEKFDLPNTVEMQIKLFMKLSGLNSGSIDMIVSKSGEYIFLEINPSGQWYFVQKRTGVDIAKMIAEQLLTKGR